MGSIPTENGHLPAEVEAADFSSHEFDYIVCGGGTAGLVVAARLSENPDVSVGVIEAGGNHLNDPLVDTPAMFFQMFNNDEYDWKFMTTPQRGNMEQKEHHVVRGKMLGGSSGINYMMYVRGSLQDYDDWAEISGDDGWSAQNMKQYMKKHQTLDPIDPSVTDRSTMPFIGENHGTSGPIHTSFNPWKLDIEDDIVKAADQATGFAKKPMDPWSGDHIGFYHTLAAIDRTGTQKGKRSYAARGYFEAVANRPNLKVVTRALVTKIVLDGKRATGVEYESHGQKYQAKVKREVIVSGGPINSPQILELSGIGESKVLQAAGVETKIENDGVGNDFQDHVVVAAAYETTSGIPTLDSIANPEVLNAAMKALTEAQTGPLTCTSTVQGFFPWTLFVDDAQRDQTISSIEGIKDQTEYHKKQRATIVGHLKDNKSANLQLVLVAATPNVKEGHFDQSKIFPTPTDPSAPNGFTLALCLQYPVSRGHVHIKSSDPKAHPEVDPGYLTHDADVEVLAAGMKFLDALANSPALKGKVSRRIHPSPERDLSKWEDCKEAVLDWYMGEYHVCGSVAMGNALDSKLKVKGTDNIRVIDASIFPGNVSGNIMSSVYMLAERGADIIKEEANAGPLKQFA